MPSPYRQHTERSQQASQLSTCDVRPVRQAKRSPLRLEYASVGLEAN